MYKSILFLFSSNKNYQYIFYFLLCVKKYNRSNRNFLKIITFGCIRLKKEKENEFHICTFTLKSRG